MKRSNQGKGLEGIGTISHETVAFDPKDLAAGVDTLIKVAGQCLKKFPLNKASYRAPK